MDELANRASALARMWATRDAGRPGRVPARFTRFAARPGAAPFAERLFDAVLTPADPRAAAAALAELPDHGALGPADRALLAAGRGLAPILPRLAAEGAKGWARGLLRDVVVDADHLTHHIAATLAAGFRVNLRPLGPRGVGDAGARQRLARIIALLQRPDVDYVSVKVADLCPPVNLWDFDGEVERLASRLRRLYTVAGEEEPGKFVSLDPDSHRDLALAIAAFEQVLGEPEFMHLSAGLTLQAYLPDSAAALERLIDFATARTQAGGAPLKVRLTKGSNLRAEAAEAERNGWPTATYPSKANVDGNFLHLIATALDPRVAYALRTGVASHNLFHLAYAHLLAQERGVAPALDIEMIHGTARALAHAVQAEASNPLLLYTPVADMSEVAPTREYVLRRLEEAAGPANFLRSAGEGHLDAPEAEFLAALEHRPPQRPRRSGAGAPAAEPGVRTPALDPAIPKTRRWAGQAIEAAHPPGQDGPGPPDPAATAGGALASALAAAKERTQAPLPAQAGASIARALATRRAMLLGVLVRETGRTIAEADREIRRAIDLAARPAEHAGWPPGWEEEGLEFEPGRVVAVLPPWNAPVSGTVGGALAALGAGAAAVVAGEGPAGASTRVAAAALAHGLEEAGADPELVQWVDADESETRRELLAHDDVDAVVFAGDRPAAEALLAWRAGRADGAGVHVTLESPNAMVITPSADLERAATDLVRSAFAYAGQDRAAVRLAVVVGTVARTEQFTSLLAAAASSLQVDWSTRPQAEVGPLLEPASGPALEELTTCAEGEEWVLRPIQLDDEGRLWRPGIKVGLAPGAVPRPRGGGAPVLGIMEAPTMRQALAWLGEAGGLGIGAIHSASPAEIAEWVDAAPAGWVVVNRASTGAVLPVSPFGGRGAGGPGEAHLLAMLGRWRQVAAPRALGQVGPRVGAFLEGVAPWLSEDERQWLETAARSDAHARDVYRVPREILGLESESNVAAYRAARDVTIRAGAGARPAHLARVLAAALAVGAAPDVSLAPEFAEGLDPAARTALLGAGGPGEGAPGLTWRVETRAEFLERAAAWEGPGRVRCLDPGEVPAVEQVAGPQVHVTAGPPLQSGRVELLAFLGQRIVTRRHW